MRMDNGSEVFAKLPNPNGGPAHLSVASEVATREMLRDVFDLPIPRVLSWSSDAANTPVEAEYIIEEKALGGKMLRNTIEQLAEMRWRGSRNMLLPEQTITGQNKTESSLKMQGDEPSSANVLWHRDLHLDNIFVDPDTCRITRIVDWQAACVAPLFYQAGVPRLCRHAGPVREAWVVPERPADFESLPENEQKRIDDDLESETLHKYYEAQVYKRSPLHWAVLQQRTIPILRKPVWLVSGVWENRDLFFLREALMDITTHWSEFFADITCPIEFSGEDIEWHSKEEENIKGVGQMMLMFRQQSVLPVNGMVGPGDYELACENYRKFKETFIGLAQDEEERELFRNLWPYKEPVDT
ncbi:hypothetical protein BJX68DRAFT_272174 [Aspergillus pseudodeflectus]|uniref:Altered inheritance of mitochondria protein 9, mitochondrial n=1 Tax=Aspergillus pseudodeflectus TaxID=176178 RepID=A0ABR4JGY4_9EURO